MRTSTKVVLFGAATLALTGLAKKLLEGEVERLKALAIIHETAAFRAGNDDDGYVFQKKAERYHRLANLAEIGEWLNHASYWPLREAYDRFFKVNYRTRKT